MNTKTSSRASIAAQPANTKVRRLALLGLVALSTLHSPLTALGQGTAFTYQGRLNTSGSTANGVYDFTFQAFDAPVAGSSVGGTVNLSAVGVTNGLFTALVDLGSTPFTGPARWLQISVSTNGAGSFTTLAPRQPLTPSPYAIYAHTAGTVTNGGIANAQLAANSVAAGNIQASAITSGKIASGQVVRSLNGLTDAVSLTQGANVTINTVGSSLQISAATGVPTLPFSGSASSTGSVFTIANSGAGPAGVFLGKVGIGTTSPGALIHARGNVPAMILQDTASAANQAGYVTFWNNAPAETAWVGFGTAGSPDFSVVNARNAGDLVFHALGGGDISVPGASVGIGTATPLTKLDVRGDIRLGPSGQFRATSGEENLRIIRGRVLFPPAGGATRVNGSGFSVTQPTSERRYVVTFTTPFGGQPAVVVTIDEGETGLQKLYADTFSVTRNQAGIRILEGGNNNGNDRTFEFIAVGPR